MEDAATAEIARSQVWQWLHNGIELDTGEHGHPRARRADRRRGDRRSCRRPGRRYADARATFMEVAVADDFAEFLTLPAYERMP